MFSFILSACASGAKYTVEKNHAFIEPEGHALKVDIYRPKSAAENTTLHPAVIVVHGGSWTSRTGDMENICIKLAKNGFVAFNVTYRLAPAHLYPKAVEDVKAAFTWVRQNAAAFQVDPEQLFTWGYSAGAHLALLAGLDPQTGTKGIVAGGAPTDLTKYPDSPITAKFLGKTFAQDPTIWKEASPVQHVTEKAPPAFLYHGSWDDIVDPKHVDWLEAEYKKRGIRFERYEAPLQGHIMTYLFSRKSDSLGIEFLKSLAKKKPGL